MNGQDIVEQTGIIAIVITVLLQVVKSAVNLDQERRRYLPLVAVALGIVATVACIQAELVTSDKPWNWWAQVVYGALNGAAAIGLYAVPARTGQIVRSRTNYERKEPPPDPPPPKVPRRRDHHD